MGKVFLAEAWKVALAAMSGASVINVFLLLYVARERRSLAGIFKFNLEPEVRTASTHFRVPEPGIPITRDHISKALEHKRLGLISERALVYWATMLLLNDAYELDPKDEDFVAGWLNDISYNLDPT
ncbi:hypothetical protein [Edaphobacter bradus]|uniref:hypothetical protein n=1 Tax=Edaphobacter bradus TaxID=2259016 RepID=UPI0021E04349|nr:hypothetical protein [Edaphobacter bradus]